MVLTHNSFPGDHRALVPPDPIPNSEVKRCIADGSVGFPHVRVGHRQVFNLNALILLNQGVFFIFEMDRIPGFNIFKNRA